MEADTSFNVKQGVGASLLGSFLVHDWVEIADCDCQCGDESLMSVGAINQTEGLWVPNSN